MDKTEKTLSAEQIFTGKVFRVTHERVRLVDGRITRREVVWHGGGACIAALDAERNIYLVRQYRYPFKKEILELPAGKLEPGESPEACAVRELREETGMLAQRAELLSDSYATPAYCSEVLHIYYALDVQKGEQALDPGEYLDVVVLPFAQAYEMVLSGKIHDAKTQIGILKLNALLAEKENSCGK